MIDEGAGLELLEVVEMHLEVLRAALIISPLEKQRLTASIPHN